MHALSTDHSPLLISLLNGKPDKNGNDFCKFNNSLVNDVVYVEKMKKKKKKKKRKINNSNEFMETAKTIWKF